MYMFTHRRGEVGRQGSGRPKEKGRDRYKKTETTYYQRERKLLTDRRKYPLTSVKQQ